MHDPLAPLPPLDRYCLTLRLAAPVVLPFEHGGVLRGLLSRALGQHELPPGLIPFACESGRVRFRAGDRYRLMITLVGEARAQEEALLAGIAQVGGRVARGPAPVLGGNFVLEATDVLPTIDLDAEMAQIVGQDELVLMLRSPLCLPRPKGPNGARSGIFDQHCFPTERFFDRLWRRRFFLEHGRYPRSEERAAQPSEAGEAGEACSSAPSLLTVDVPVRGTGERKPSYNLEGVRGRVIFRGLSESARHCLAVGMFLHVGKSISFGFGRYTIEGTHDHADTLWRPTTSLLARAADPEVLEDAVAHLRKNLREKHAPLEYEPLKNGTLRNEDEPIPDRLILDLSRRLVNGRYQPGPLSGFVLAKKDGGVRPLAVPSVRDRVAQRAAVEVLAPIIDTLLEDASFAYRRGFSRQGAARAIERAYAEGYRYVLDADIHAFFDQVDWSLLFGKLEALFPQEPLVELLKTWIQAPVIFEGRRIRRHRGLPQGSPISPVLANLYLDELDEALIDQGFKLVRFADDFVVLTKNLEQARAAKVATEQVLRDLRLSLNEDETAIRAIDDGFSYLGYLFVRSMVIEKRSLSSDSEPTTEVSLDADDVPAGSWLAGVPLQRIEELLSGRRGPKSVAGFERVPLATDAALDAGRWPLYIVGHDTRLFLRKRTVVLKRAGQEPTDVPIEALSHVVFWGRVRATVPVLRGLARAGVPAYFCEMDGTLEAVFAPHQDPWPNWLAQARAADDTNLCLRFAMATIEARLRNLAVMVVRLGWGGGSPLAAQLRELAKATVNKQSLDSVRGLEGRGMALVFGALKDALDPEWGFTGRDRRPPPDPVNAMLSFGYSLLYHHTATALTEAGLSPRIGLVHEPRGAHQALASDLMEEVRHVVESLVWTLIRRRQIKPSDFRPSPDGYYPSLLTPEARRVFLDAFERRLLTQLTPEQGEEPMSYRMLLVRQARQVRELVNGRQSTYRPLMIRG